MANELNIQLDPFLETGLTLLAKVFNLNGTQQGSDVSLTETSVGFYSGNFDVSGLSDGDYAVKFQTTTEFYGSGVLSVRNGVEVIVPDNAGIAAIKAKTDALPSSPASEDKVQEAVDAAKLAAALSA